MAHRHPIRFVITYHLFVSKGENQTYGLIGTLLHWMTSDDEVELLKGKRHTLFVRSPQINLAHAWLYKDGLFSK